MSARRTILRVAGAAAVLGLAAAGAGACSGGGGGGRIEVTAYFDAAVGVYDTGDVLVLDSPVGEVTDVTLEADRVRVDLSIREDVPLPADVQATIEAQTVLGERNVTLFPSWSAELEAEDAPRLRDGAVIGLDRTTVPVEPDEALQSFNQLVSELDADVVGGLVSDASRILDGRGETLGRSLETTADLSETLAAVDEPLLDAAESLNRIAAVVNQRESQVRSLVEDFGVAVGTLAAERADTERLLSGLVGLTGEVGRILDVHGRQIPDTIASLVATMQVVQTNTDALTVMIDELPVVAESFEDAYKPEISGFYLSVNTLAVVETVVQQLLDAVGLFPGEI